MASVHLWTEATESFVASSNNLAEATKLSGPIISKDIFILLMSENMIFIYIVRLLLM